MIDFADTIPEEIRLKVQFSIAKVAIQRLNHLENALFGKEKPSFKVDPDDWESLKGTSAIKKVFDEL